MLGQHEKQIRALKAEIKRLTDESETVKVIEDLRDAKERAENALQHKEDKRMRLKEKLERLTSCLVRSSSFSSKPSKVRSLVKQKQFIFCCWRESLPSEICTYAQTNVVSQTNGTFRLLMVELQVE